MMILFPRPRNMEVQEGKYRVKHTYPTQDLRVFFDAVKEGNDEITVSVQPLLKKEEYILEYQLHQRLQKVAL